MPGGKRIWFCPALLILISTMSDGAALDFPFQAQRLSDRVLFIKTGESTVMSNVTAINTSGGIVLVDTHYKPEYGKEIRDIIEQSFGQKRFSYVIYSHAGVDHIGGVRAFRDAVIIGHENCISQIDSLHQTIRSIDIQKVMSPRLKLIRDEIEEGTDDTLRMTLLKESLLYWGELTDLAASGFMYTKPSITFSDRLALQLGELTFRLCYCTPGYSQSDILIHIPQEKLLIVGDIFEKHRIPLLDEKTDIDRWLAVFKPFMENQEEIRHVIGCHGALMTLDDLRPQLDYLGDLWNAVKAARQEGLTLEQAKLRLAFKTRYPYLEHLITSWVGVPLDLHDRNIEQAWKGLDGASK